MSSCSVCGSTMVHFENPDREECPTPGKHAAIERDERQKSKGDHRKAGETGHTGTRKGGFGPNRKNK